MRYRVQNNLTACSIAELTSSPVLLEAPFDPSRRQKNSVLLAIDLTTAVADEAIQRKDSAVVAYRMSHLFNIIQLANPCPTVILPGLWGFVVVTTQDLTYCRPNHFPWSQVRHPRGQPAAISPTTSPTRHQRLLPPHRSRHCPGWHGRLAL